MKAEKVFKFLNSYIVVPLLVTISGAVIYSLVDIYPNIRDITNMISNVNKQIISINRNITKIEDRYTKKDDGGRDCMVGISADVESNFVSVYESNDFGLKGTDVIYITNPYGKFSPTIKCIVVVKQDDKGRIDSKANLFVSKEAISRLDITKNNISKGVFNMKLHIKE